MTSLVLRKNAIIRANMSRQATVVLYVVAMAAIIVGVDFAFFRNRFWERLAVNIVIVLVFGAFLLEIPASMIAAVVQLIVRVRSARLHVGDGTDGAQRF